MADVQVTQGGGSSAAAWLWALVAIVVLAILAWIFLGGGFTQKKEIDVDINVPTATSGGPPGAVLIFER